jgi:hypothetical protein
MCQRFSADLNMMHRLWENGGGQDRGHRRKMRHPLINAALYQ